MTVIQIQQVAMNFGHKQILKGVSSKIEAGEIVGLIGLNGAGKSTLIKLMLGLLVPTKGQIKILGENPGQSAHLDKVGVMFQKAHAVTHLSVRDQLDWLRSFYKNPAPLSELLAAADLTEFAKQPASSLSGGQLQRLCFAQALSGQPDLIFLDEPTAGMDTVSRQKFWYQIGELKKAGKTVILTSHYLNEVEQTASRLLILQDGHFIHDGSLISLQDRFSEQKIVFQSSLAAEIFKKIADVNSAEKQGSQITIKTKNADKLLHQLMAFQPSEISDLSVQRSSLDDLFTELVAVKEEQAS